MSLGADVQRLASAHLGASSYFSRTGLNGFDANLNPEAVEAIKQHFPTARAIHISVAQQRFSLSVNGMALALQDLEECRMSQGSR
jgi:hypothetical protein